MSYPESCSSFMTTPQSTYAGSDAVGIWPNYAMNEGQFDPHSEFEQHQSPFKRPRHSEDSQSNVVQCTPTNSRMSLNPPVNKGISNIFFKTRMCAKFRIGACRNGEGCNFAHGIEDLRQPPPNWQELVGGGGGGREEERLSGNWDDDQKIIHRMKLCKKFYNGEECPYGDRCNFLHQDPSKFRDDIGRFRESSAISIGTTTGPPAGQSIAPDQSEGNRPVNNTGLEAFRGIMKPVYWKTKLCTKWEITGHCPFGEKCHFAHGQSELQGMSIRVDGDFGNTGSTSTTRTGSLSTKNYNLPVNDTPPVAASFPSLNEEGQTKKCLIKWKGTRKINRIYGDWLDDLPLSHNLPSQVES